jgi:hypothetical protein
MIGQIVANILSGLSLTPPQELIKCSKKLIIRPCLEPALSSSLSYSKFLEDLYQYYALTFARVSQVVSWLKVFELICCTNSRNCK